MDNRPAALMFGAFLESYAISKYRRHLSPTLRGLVAFGGHHVCFCIMIPAASSRPSAPQTDLHGITCPWQQSSGRGWLL